MAYKIDENVCISCGSCAGECPTEAISAGDNSYVIDADKCISCGTCASGSPTEAISEEETGYFQNTKEGYGSGRAPFRFPCRNVLPAFRPADRYFS